MIKNFEKYINEDYFSKLASRKDNNYARREYDNIVKLDNGKTLHLKNPHTAEIINYLFDTHEDDDVYGIFNMKFPSGNNWGIRNIGEDMTTELNDMGYNSFNKVNAAIILTNAIEILKEEGDALDEIIPSIDDFAELNETCYITYTQGGAVKYIQCESIETGEELDIRIGNPYVVLDRDGQKKLFFIKTIEHEHDSYVSIDVSEKNIEPFVLEPWIQFRPIIKGMWKN